MTATRLDPARDEPPIAVDGHRCVTMRGSAAVTAVLALAVLLASAESIAQSPGTITTVAGGGPAAMPAIDASLRQNVKVVSDSTGNLYVSDGFAHRVYYYARQSGTLSPLAGTGFRGNTGDGGPAIDAGLDNPHALALDEARERLYIQDNNIVRMVDLATGTISRFAGSGGSGSLVQGMPATQAPLPSIGDIAVDTDGVVYIADTGTWRIWAVENGVLSSVAGSGVWLGGLDGPGGNPADDYVDGVQATTAALGSVSAMAVDSVRRRLYFYDQAARYRRVDLDTRILTTYAGNGYTYGSFDGQGGDLRDDIVDNVPALQSALAYTTSLAIDAGTGDLYALNYSVWLVRRISSDGGAAGTIVTVAGGGVHSPEGVPPGDAIVADPTGLSLDGQGTLYVAARAYQEFSGYAVYAITDSISPVVGNGYGGYCGDGGPANAACLNEPTSARFDPAGNLIVLDGGNLRVRSVSATGTITSLIPDLFSGVVDLWPLASGEFYVSDQAHHTVYHARPPYQGYTTFAGTGVATGSIDGEGGDPGDDLWDGELAWVASLNAPAGLVQDAFGNTFIADSGNHRVRRVDAVNGLISTIAGTGVAGFNGDGQPATATELHDPYGVAFDTNGDLLVSERDGHRVRRISAGGDGLVTGEPDEIVSTVAGTGVPGFSGDEGHPESATLRSPTGVAVDVLGSIYIADTGNRAIRRVDPQSALIDTIAGRGVGGDDSPAVDSRLEEPIGLTTYVVDGTNYLYVTDSVQNRVRRIDLGEVQVTGNQPPVIEILPFDGAVVNATSPDGATIALYALASDPDGDFLTYTWSGPFGTATGLGAAVLLPIGQNTVMLAVDDGHGHVVHATATIIVNGENTFTGNGEVVTPPDSRGVRLIGETPGRATVTFLGPVTTPGLTWLRTRTDQTPPPPAGKQLGSAPFYYDIATTAVAHGDVRICLDLTGMSFAFPGQVELHRLDGGWVGLGVSPDAVTRTVCIERPFAQAFGTYGNFTPADAASLVTTVAGNGLPRDTGDGGPAIQAGVNIPEGLAFDPARNLLYIGQASHRVRRVNLADGAIETIAGTGDFSDEPVDGIDARLSSIGSIAAVALDADGNLFIGDQSHCLIRRVDRQTNVITTVAGRWLGPGLSCGHTGDGGSATAARIGFASGLAFDAQGNLLFVEQPTLAGEDGGFVRRVAPGADGRITGDDPEETIETVAGNGLQDPFVSTGTHPLNAGVFPRRIAVGATGDVYVTETNGVLLLSRGADGVLNGSADEVVIRVFGGPAGFQLPFHGDGGPARDAYADFLNGLTVLPSGDVVVAGPGVHRVRRISAGADGVVNGSADEMVTTIAGFSDDTDPPVFNGDGYALSTSFAAPSGVAAGEAGSIFVADPLFHRVRRVGVGTGGGDPGVAGADLSVTATGSLQEAGVGQPVRYTVHLTNNGPATANGVTLTMSVPSGFRLDSGQGPVGCSLSVDSEPTVCHAGTLTAGQQLTFTFDATPLVEGAMSATFAVAGQESDPHPANNAVTIAVDIVPTADLAVSIAAPASGAVVNVGSPLTFDVVVTNLGPSSALTVRLQFPLPSGVEPVSATIPGGVCQMPGGIVVCDTGTVAAGANLHAIVVVLPTAAGAIAGTLDVSAARYDPNPVNNTAAVTVTAEFAPVMINVTETITVSDEPQVAPQAPQVVLALTPTTATNPVGTAHTVTAVIADGSDEAARVVLTTTLGVPVRVQLVDPGAANSPLSVSVSGTDITLSLATNAAAALASVAAHVIAAINADPAASTLVTAAVWPGTAGSGIVQPRPLAALTHVRFATTGTTTLAPSCITSVPGVCAITYSSVTTGTDTIGAYLDANGSGTQDPDEPSATAEKTWVDLMAPELSLPGNITSEATGPGGTSVNFVAAANDAVDGPRPVSCTPASGSTFALGTTTVTCSASDTAGNVATGSFSVTVVDTTPPVLTLPANVTTPATTPAGAPVTYTATAFDTVSGPVTPVCSPVSGAFPNGTTAVTCTAVDAAGNLATGGFTVTVTFVQLTATATFARSAAGHYEAQVTVRNAGTGVASAVHLAIVQLNNVSGTNVPAALGTLAPGASTQVGVAFPPSVGTPGPANSLRLQLTWTGGSAAVALRATLP